MKDKSGWKKYIRLGAIFFLASFVLFAPRAAGAADPWLPINDSSYVARYTGQSIPDPITLEAGESKIVKFYFKNIGTATWNNEGNRFVSAYTVEPRHRKSVFFGSGWVDSNQIGKMAGTIKPGETGEFGVPLHAPDTPGEYKEEFYLAAENYTWLKGGWFYADIKVIPKTAEPIAEPDAEGQEESETPEPATDDKYGVIRILQSKKSASAAGGDRIELKLGYQNESSVDWQSYQVTASSPAVVSEGSAGLTLADPSWQDSTVVLNEESAIAKDDSFWVNFYFRAPAKKGAYTAEFILTADGKMIDRIIMPITVISDAAANYQEPVFGNEEIPWLNTEPRIKVGLWKPTAGVNFGSTEDNYKVYAGAELRGTLPQNDLATLSYVNGAYHFSDGELNFATDEYIRLEPETKPHAVFELVNYSRVVSWKGSLNFNKYRGAMEFRIGQVNPELWVVNDLLFEDYVRGVAENSNNSPIEYLKAQSVAQRSYAYAIQQTDKYGIFDVVATTGDQLYLGFNSESQLSRFVEAAQATRGYMATYNNSVVLTPYFANTNGRTRSWQSVWGGANKPWLVSVRCEYDDGRTMLGHGVGMSQLDAAARAEKEGLTWRELVKYYYTGVEINKIYD